MSRVTAEQRSHVDQESDMAIRDARPRHARTAPQGYPPPEAYGPIVFPTVPQQATGPSPHAYPTAPPPAPRAPAAPPAPAAHPAPPAHPAPANNLATSGFIVAAVGAVLSLVPVIGMVAWLLCPTGLGLSVAGLVGADRRAGAGRGLAIAGVALGAVGLVVCLLWVLALAR